MTRLTTPWSVTDTTTAWTGAMSGAVFHLIFTTEASTFAATFCIKFFLSAKGNIDRINRIDYANDTEQDNKKVRELKRLLKRKV